MARKKSRTPDDVNPPGMTDASGRLATFAGGVLGQPASRAHEVSLKLSRSERAILVGVPGLDVTLKGRLDTLSTGVKSFPFTMNELASIVLALSEVLLDAEGRDAVKLLNVTGKVTDLLNQAIADVERAGKPRRAAPKAGKSTAMMASGTIYQLKITLKDVKPPVWRRLLVTDCSLAKLHEIIQAAMGWENYHMYDFEVGGEHYTDPRGMADLDMKDASRAKLGQLAPEGKAKFPYTYDFGDNWQHDVLVEKVSSTEEGQAYPACIDGKRACPPEDVGGPWGYMEFVEAIRDPKHERHEDLVEWRGEFDPEEFDLEAVNERLNRLR